MTDTGPGSGTSQPGTSQPVGGPGFWIAAAVGWAVIAYGAAGLVTSRGATDAVRVAAWVGAGHVAHDLVVAPAALVAGTLLALVAPRWLRAPLRFALFASACALALALPALGGFGRKPRNPSLLPLNAPTALLWVVAAVWGLAGLWAGVRLLRARCACPPWATSRRSAP